MNGLLDSVKRGSVYLHCFQFGKNKNGVDEFAIRVGDAEHCTGSEIYYFEGNRIIAKQDGYSKYFDDDVQFYKADDKETIVYRLYEFSDGSGIWWNNYFFYKYSNGKLMPVLNLLQNGNMQEFWGARVLWLESTVLKTHPLTVKMVYYLQFYKHNDEGDSSGYKFGPKILNDSTIVKYAWDDTSKTLKGQYGLSKITEPQLITYYLENNEKLFINAYYPLLKRSLKNKKRREWIFRYLNNAKNHG